MRDNLSTLRAIPAIWAQRTRTDVTGVTIPMIGSRSLVFSVDITVPSGNALPATKRVHVQIEESEESNRNFSDVDQRYIQMIPAPGDSAGRVATIDQRGQTHIAFGYLGNKPFVRIKVIFSSAWSEDVDLSARAILGHLEQAP